MLFVMGELKEWNTSIWNPFVSGNGSCLQDIHLSEINVLVFLFYRFLEYSCQNQENVFTLDEAFCFISEIIAYCNKLVSTYASSLVMRFLMQRYEVLLSGWPSDIYSRPSQDIRCDVFCIYMADKVNWTRESDPSFSLRCCCTLMLLSIVKSKLFKSTQSYYLLLTDVYKNIYPLRCVCGKDQYFRTEHAAFYKIWSSHSSGYEEFYNGILNYCRGFRVL
jgi:hypothetical protein